MLTKEQIWSADDRKSVMVDVPEWGGQVKLMAMTGHAKDAFEASIMGKNGGMNTVNIRAKLAAACIVDSENKLMFTQEEVTKLGLKSAVALDRIFTAAQKLNAIGDKEIEELAKN